VIHLVFRTQGVVNDVKLDIRDNMTGLEVKQAYIVASQDKGMNPSRLRLFFSGKELKESALMAEYNLINDHVVQAFKAKAP